VPYPPDYGGVIDVYHKITALARAGVQIHLHCFQYGRPEAAELEQWCASVHYYPRKAMWTALFSRTPFIVATRASRALRARLLEDAHPILFEGLHGCHLLTDPALQSRVKMVRMHNDEAQYYGDLAAREQHFFRRWYFTIESARLRRYEQVLEHADAICCISPAETDHFKKRFPQTVYVPAFHGHDQVSGRVGKGDFVLYHGNLSVNENVEAAMFLIKDVFSKIQVPLVIAGAAPDPQLYAAIQGLPHICIEADPSHERLQQLICEAQIHFLPAFQQTGIKLKLLNALFNGRHCLVTRQMVEGTGLEPYCLLIHTPEEAIEALATYMHIPFTQEDLQFRKPSATMFSDAHAADQIRALMQAPVR